MTVTGQSLTIYRGQDLDITLDVDEAITGWELEFTLRDTRRNVVDVTLTTGAGITITDGAAGTCTIALSDTDTDTLEAGTGRYLWSVWRTDDGSENPLATGTATVVKTSRG